MMRAKLIMAIAAVMCLTLAGAEEKNLLVNPGFEDGSWRGGPTSWNVTYGNWKIVDGGLENSKALEVSSVNVPEHKRIKLSFVQAINNPAMGKYLLKGNLKGEFTEVLTVLSSPKMEPQVTVLKKDQCPQKDGWNNFEVTSSIPEGAGTVSMVIEVWMEKEGVPVLFDNISLERVGDIDKATAAQVAVPVAVDAGKFAAQQQISGKLVARPAAATDVKWNLPVIAGRDYWQLLDIFLHTTKGVENEDFIKNAGYKIYDDGGGRNQYIFEKLYSNPIRQIALNEIEIYQQGISGNSAGKGKFTVKGDEPETDISFIENINDGKVDTSAFISGDPSSQKKRYTPVIADITVKLTSADPVTKLVIRSTEAAAVASVSFKDASGKEIKPADVFLNGGVITATFETAPKTDTIVINCKSLALQYRIRPRDEKLAKELEKVPFLLAPPYRSSSGSMFGLTVENNFDKASFESFLKRYKNTFLGFDYGEWDSNFYQFKRGSNDMYGEYFEQRPDKDRYEAEKNLHNLFALHRELAFDYAAPHSGSLKFQQYAMEYGATISNIQNSTENPYLEHRLNAIFGRGAGRQYDKPWGTYLAYHVGPYIPGEYDPGINMGPCFGASPSYTNRYFYYCYYMGASFQEFESQNGFILKNKDSEAYSLTDDGKAVKDIYEWTRNPGGKRGDAYSPILLLMDYYHGHIEWRRDAVWMTWYQIPFDDGDFMAEHIMRIVSPRIDGIFCNKAPYNTNLMHSKTGELFDVFFANPPSGVISMYELGRYPVVVLMDKIDIKPELAKNLKEYVNAGGTLLINSAQADVFKNDEEFLGLKMLDGFTDADAMKFRNVKLGNAAAVMSSSTGLPLMTRNSYGKGSVLFTSPDFMLLTANKKQIPPALEKIMLALNDEVSPVKVKGDIVHIFNRMPDGTWKIILINNKGVSKEPNASADVIYPEYAAKVTLTVPGDGATAVEVKAGEKLVKDGNTFTTTVPSGEVRVVDIKGVDFKEKEITNALIGADEFGKSTRTARVPVKSNFIVNDVKVTKYPAHPNKGLITEWTFNEGSGDIVKDTSGNGCDAKIKDLEYVKTKAGYALKFSGDKTYFIGTFPEELANFKTPYYEGSIELWAKPNMTDGKFALNGKVANVFCTRLIHVIINSDGCWGSMISNGAAGVSSIAGPKALDGKWQQAVFTWKDFTIRFYVDGEEVVGPAGRMKIINNIFPHNNTSCYVGSHYYGGGGMSAFSGELDDIRIFGRSFTADEIRKRYEDGKNER